MKACPPEHKRKLWQELETRLGYRFQSRELLHSAMCHRSFENEHPDLGIENNERLEFLGDAVLDLVIAQQLLATFPDHHEGELTRIRAELVAEPFLARLARKLSLGSCLLLGRGEKKSGGENKPSLLADTLEALFGAVFLDGGYAAAAEVIQKLIGPCLVQTAGGTGQDYKTRLQEFLQSRQSSLPSYVLLETEGPHHDRTYHVQVLINDQVSGQGRGRTKKSAEQAAARAALEALDIL